MGGPGNTKNNLESESERKLILVRGHSEGYKLAFCGVLRLKIEPENETLERVSVFASEDKSKIYDLEFSSPEETKTVINQKLDDMTDRNIQKDTRQFKSKFRKNFDRSSFLTAACEALREQENDRFREIFNNRMEKKIFPGSDCQTEIKIFSYETKKHSAEKDPIYERIQKNIVHKLDVEPYISPAEGRRLENIDLNKKILVRVVGESVSRLNPSLLDEDAPGDEPYSRPMPARLAALKVGPSPGTVQFWVNFKEDIYGEGMESESIRVGVYKQKEVVKNDSRQIFIILGSSLLFLFACFFFLFIGFPQYFFYLLF